MGTGGLQFPRDVVAETMFNSVIEFSKKNPGTSVKDVRFVLYDKDQPTIDVSTKYKLTKRAGLFSWVLLTQLTCKLFFYSIMLLSLRLSVDACGREIDLFVILLVGVLSTFGDVNCIRWNTLPDETNDWKKSVQS